METRRSPIVQLATPPHLSLETVGTAAPPAHRHSEDPIDYAIPGIPDCLADGVFVSDVNGRLLFMNEAATKLTGRSLEECRGRLLHELIHPAHRDGSAFPARHCPLMESRESMAVIQDYDDILFSRDGTSVDVSYSSAPYVINGQLVGTILTARDMTRRRQREAALLQTQKMEAIGSLTGGLAHDFNNLLGVIIGSLDLLISGRSTDAETTELATDALEAALKGAELTRNLLAFARRQPLQPELKDLNQWIIEIGHHLEDELGQSINFRLDLEPELWPVMIDPVQLEVSLKHLATNARDAMPHGGCITISTSNCCLLGNNIAPHTEIEQGEFVLLEFSDDGAGMDPVTLAQIFRPFFSGKKLGEGHGLGLSMVHGFVKQSGGHIEVRSQPGKGTNVELYLPRAMSEFVSDTMSIAAACLPQKSETILVVEDDEILRKVVTYQLTREGYGVVEAQDAAEALEILATQPVDLLFTDIVMPGEMNGFELALTAHKQKPALRILLTSGFPDLSDDENTFGAMHWRLLTKPYRNVDIKRVIREVLNE